MNPKRLYKGQQRMVAGVCSGIAEYFNIDPTLGRLITVVLGFAGFGTALLAYLVCAVVMP